MSRNYWSSVLNQRITRRRALTATGATTAGAMLLAACGGGDSGGGGDQSGLVYKIVDETKDVKRGGTYIARASNYPTNFDPMKTGNQIRLARRGFSQLFRIPDGHLALETNGAIEGDVAQSWELSPDKLTITVKIDPGAGLPPVPPVNGRAADAEDVVFSWNRLKTEGIGAKDLVNELNPAAPILSITAPDKSTVVVKLKEPNAAIFTALGSDVLGTLYIFAKEAADPAKLDALHTAIGTGPYYISNGSEQSIAGSATRTSSAPPSRTTSPTSTRSSSRSSPTPRTGWRSSAPAPSTSTACLRRTSSRPRRTCLSSCCAQPRPAPSASASTSARTRTRPSRTSACASPT